jgi:putative toxin-antitoxin system antitoxin component (TIGR02293 family)
MTKQLMTPPKPKTAASPPLAAKTVKKPTAAKQGELVSAAHVARQKVTETTAANLIQRIKSGLPLKELDALRRELNMPMEKLAPLLGISKATLHRRKAAGRLSAEESDRVVRFERLVALAAEVMESAEDGRRWLASTQLGLGGAIPLEYAQTEAGAREVEALLGRIEHGVYA